MRALQRPSAAAGGCCDASRKSISLDSLSSSLVPVSFGRRSDSQGGPTQDRGHDQRACMDEVSHRERLSVSPRAGNLELHQLVELIEDRLALRTCSRTASSPSPSATSLPATRKIAFRPSAPPSPNRIPSFWDGRRRAQTPGPGARSARPGPQRRGADPVSTKTPSSSI
eukprot:scaffold50906_cov56-Phaeocystis_antarctica.AAC.3